MAIFINLIMAIFMFQNNKTKLVWKKNKTKTSLAGAQLGSTASADQYHYWREGEESVKAVWHTDTPPLETSAMQREDLLFHPPPLLTTHTHTHHKTTTRSLRLSRYSARPNKFPLLVSVVSQ